MTRQEGNEKLLKRTTCYCDPKLVGSNSYQDWSVECFNVDCQMCGCELDGKYKTNEEAIKVWNSIVSGDV